VSAFLDSNILLYAIGSEPAKADRADSLVRAGGIISVQVLNEIAKVCVRKRGLAPARVNLLLGLFKDLLQVVPVTVDAHDLAMEMVARHRLAVWDASIVAAALLAGCETLWSEDMHDGLVIDSRLTIRNPFA
jgi:predicted nucleic acid-binding protein